MKKYDVAVIGGGLLGCFATRELMRYGLTAVLLEKREDVCTGISKANTAIIYPGYDNKSGTLKQSLTLRANSGFDRLCAELQVPFSRCGSLMVSYGEKADAVLAKKLETGLRCGVPGLRMLDGREAREMESALADGVRSALFAPSAGTVDPWQLCYAAFENAVDNGCDYLPETEVIGLCREDGAYVIETDRGELTAAFVINCGGLAADKIQEMLFEPSVRIYPEGADYLLLERGSAELKHIVQHESEQGKGVTAVPTVGGSILLGPSEREPEKELSAVSAEGLEGVRRLAAEVLPGLQGGNVIRSFAGIRPIIKSVVLQNGAYVPDGRSIGGFAIETPEPGFLSFIGIKTPGLTCARELGAMAAERAADYLQAKFRTDFDPERKAQVRVRELSYEQRAALIREQPDYGELVCLCEDVTLGEVRESIRRGAVTTDGIKRRCGALLGVCQGGRCENRIEELLCAELGLPAGTVRRDGSPLRRRGGGDG